MIGERIESHHNLPWGALLLLGIAVGLVVAGRIWGVNALAIGAVLPVALAGSLWLWRPERPFAARIREQGLEIESDGQPVLIPYEKIQNIKVDGRIADPETFRKPVGAIAILHDQEILFLPARLNFSAHEIYRFLAEQVPGRGERAINPVLAEYLERQEQYFGPDSVWTFRAAGRRLTGSRNRYRAFCIGLMVAGAVWMVVGLAGYVETPWGLGGFVCVLTGTLLFAASFAEGAVPSPGTKNWKNASLVIGPQGMAMVQGDIQGEVRWPELLEVRFNANANNSFAIGQAAIPGILLRVKGADIVIADVYDRPLFVIYNRIRSLSGRNMALHVES